MLICGKDGDANALWTKCLALNTMSYLSTVDFASFITGTIITGKLWREVKLSVLNESTKQTENPPQATWLSSG